MENDLICIIKHDLNYEGKSEPLIVERRRFWRLKRFDGRYLIERCGYSKYREYEREVFKEKYSKAIQSKYNVSSNWEQNRWFVEQVRPTIH